MELQRQRKSAVSGELSICIVTSNYGKCKKLFYFHRISVILSVEKNNAKYNNMYIAIQREIAVLRRAAGAIEQQIFLSFSISRIVVYYITPEFTVRHCINV